MVSRRRGQTGGDVALRKPAAELKEATTETAAENADVTFEEAMQQGRTLAEQNDLIAAKAAFQQAATLDADNAEPLLWLSRLAYRSYDWRELFARSRAFLKLRPDDREVLLLHGRACNGVGNWQAAVEAWRSVAEDRPDWPEAKYQLGRALVRIWPAGAARNEPVEEIAKALAGSLHADGQRYALRLLIEVDAIAEALEVAQSLLRENAAAALSEFEQFERTDDWRGLAVALRARLNVDGRDPKIDERQAAVAESLFRRAIASERAGALLEAFFDYDALLMLAPDDVLAQRSCARIVRDLKARAQDALARQAWPEAADGLCLAVRVSADDLPVRRNYGRVLMRLRKWDEAVKIWRDFALEANEDAEGRVQLARALDRSGRLVEAVGAWRAVLALDAKHAEALASLDTIARRMTFAGRTAIAEERFLDAHELFRCVLREDPASEEAPPRLEQVGRNVLKAMRAAYKAKEYKSLVRYSGAVNDLLPADAEAQLLIGRSAAALRRYPEAIAAWSRLAELEESRSLLANLQIARCYLHLGAAKDGQAALRKVRAIDPKNGEAKELSERFKEIA
jgi:tetratricopeptide (TPR) repeat protein